MALPDLPLPPTAPSRDQGKEAFNVNVPIWHAWEADFANTLTTWSAALPAEVDTRIETAVAAYDPTGNYSADQVDALLAASEARIANDSYFFNVTA